MCEGGYKQWTANTNFASDKNWDTGHAPCGPVSVRIPELAPQIYVQLDTTIRELVSLLSFFLLKISLHIKRHRNNFVQHQNI